MLELISSGSLEPGQRLGSERELAGELGVSRSTLRQALGVLEQAGVVRRVPGRGGGTFVSKAKIERDLSSVVGVPALLRAQGFTAGSRVISTSIVGADDATAAALALEPGALIIEIVRIRLADGSPVSLEHVRLPANRLPGLLELPLGGSVYDLLAEHYGITPSESLERIEAVAAGLDEASVLGVSPGTPLLSITRTAMENDGTPFEFSHDLFRADRTRILVRTPGPGDPRTGDPGRVIDLQAWSGT